MPLGTLDRTPPPFFKQGPSALSRLVVFSSLAFFCMVADVRFRVAQPVRAVVATVLYPLQWLTLQPVFVLQQVGVHFESLQHAQAAQEQARRELAQQALRGSRVEQLMLENLRLRELLQLRRQLTTSAQTAEVLYDAADVYTRKLIIDKGMSQGIALGSPVIDESGVLGQVTRVQPLVSEVTLVTDRDLALPVLNARTGARTVAYGDPAGNYASGLGGLELRFMAGNADVQAGDMLTTGGVDGIYPAGLPVARIDRIERRADSAFARILCQPLARVNAARHVLVLQPLANQIPPRPEPENPPGSVRKWGRK